MFLNSHGGHSATSISDLGRCNEKVKNDEKIRHDSSSANQSAKVEKGVAEVQRLPHGHTNLRIGFIVEEIDPDVDEDLGI